jgi:hypothetical protein
VVQSNTSVGNARYGYWFEQPNGVRFVDNESADDPGGVLKVTNPTRRSAAPFREVRMRAVGAPGGTIFASPGSLYLDARDDGGAPLYVKETRTDTGGWRPTRRAPARARPKAAR